MPPQADRLGAQVVHDLFGVNLQQQGRGFYVALELFAILRGVLDGPSEELLSPDVDLVRYRRRSHDLARRIATGADIDPDELAAAVHGAGTLETLNALFGSLVVSVPGRRRAPKWYAAHFYPFVGELIHYDAVERRGRPSVERYVFRDGGGWAYRVLRTDPEAGRRERTRDHLAELVSNSDSALGRVAAALGSHDSDQPPISFEDESERTCRTFEALSPWPGLLRRGVAGIVARTSTPPAKRVEQLMHWVPYCLARHELRLARNALGHEMDPIPVDAAKEANPLRTRSQGALDEYRWEISTALTRRAAELQDASPAGAADAERWSRFTQPNAPFTVSPRSFFTETLAAVGGLNATSGRRHFTFKAPMLEALVAAMVEPGQEVEFHHFCDLLFHDLSIVLDERSARDSGMTTAIDEGVFTTNAAAFRARLQAIGLLTHYSDATSLVHGEAQ